MVTNLSCMLPRYVRQRLHLRKPCRVSQTQHAFVANDCRAMITYRGTTQSLFLHKSHRHLEARRLAGSNADLVKLAQAVVCGRPKKTNRSDSVFSASFCVKVSISSWASSAFSKPDTPAVVRSTSFRAACHATQGVILGVGALTPAISVSIFATTEAYFRIKSLI